MNKKLLLIFLLVCWTTALIGNENSYKAASDNFYRLFEDESFYKYEHNWTNTIKQFKSIYQTAPNSIQATKSLYNIGNLYASLYLWNKKLEHLQNSSKFFEKLYQKYPKSYLADDALFLIASNYQKTNRNLQKSYLQKLLTEYPKSAFTKEAKAKLKIIATENSAQNTKSLKISGVSKKTSLPIVKAKIKDLDYFTTASWTRVILTLDQKLPYKYQALRADENLEIPPRFYIDVVGGILPKNFFRKKVTNNGIIRSLRISQFDPQTTRLVLDLYTLTEIKVFSTELGDDHKIIIDIFGQENKPEWENILSELDLTKSANKINLKNALGLKVSRIILDPGHGGKDPGAVYGKNYYEKSIVLKIAQILRKEINKSLPNTQVLLTRNDDSAVALERRSAFANAKKGDLFISIHVNSFTNRQVSGVETYYLNLTTNQRTLTLSARENSTTEKNVGDLQAILSELINHTKIPESKKLAQMVQSSLVSGLSIYKVKNLGVKKAPFIVLIGTQMPSILVEVGFISNKQERSLLSQTVYLQRIAKGIKQGILKYIQNI